VVLTAVSPPSTIRVAAILVDDPVPTACTWSPTLMSLRAPVVVAVTLVEPDVFTVTVDDVTVDEDDEAGPRCMADRVRVEPSILVMVPTVPPPIIPPPCLKPPGP
jgi:hypothetical protein